MQLRLFAPTSMRTPSFLPIEPREASPDYWDSLLEFSKHNERANPRSPPRIRYSPPANATRGRLLVCRDYQGGYTEQYDVRGYTFDWW